MFCLINNMCVVIPMQKSEINVNRKVSLVNTVFSGQVPNVLLD